MNIQCHRQKQWLKFLIFILYLNVCEHTFLVSEILKNRLEKNRRDLLNCPQNLPLYIVSNTEEKIPTEKVIEKESETFQKIFSDFETEEKQYLESHSAN